MTCVGGRDLTHDSGWRLREKVGRRQLPDHTRIQSCISIVRCRHDAKLVATGVAEVDVNLAVSQVLGASVVWAVVRSHLGHANGHGCPISYIQLDQKAKRLGEKRTGPG